jgi:hypothetical protein
MSIRPPPNLIARRDVLAQPTPDPGHAAITNVYRASKDLFLAQRFARHASPLTTVIYTHASDEELREGVRGLRC